MLLLAVLSICSLNIWAQSELKSGPVKFRYVHAYSSEYYLSEKSQYGQVCLGVDPNANSTDEEKTLYLDKIDEGRYLISINHMKNIGYTAGRYLFSFASPDLGFEFDPMPDAETLENSIFDFDVELNLIGYVITVNGIHMGNTLYIVGREQIKDISKLDEMVEAGTIKKINLDKANNFTFSFIQPEKGQGYPEEAVIITSESGGEISLDDRTGMAKIMGKSLSSRMSSTFIPEQTQENNTDQNEVKTGLTKFRYDHVFSSDRYLCSGQYPDTFIYVKNTSNANVFHIDAVGKGRYLMALHYEEKDSYSKGRFVSNSLVFPTLSWGNSVSSLPDDVLENCYYEGSGGNDINTVAAIHIGDALYVTPEMPASMSILNQMVQSGRVKKIDLTKTNNFIFSFNHIEDDPYDIYSDDAVRITSETIGQVVIDDMSGRAVIARDQDAAVRYSLFFIESQQKGNQDDEKIVVTPSEPRGNKGTIELSLDISSSNTITGEFTITLPDGFNLDKANTRLAQELQSGHLLEILNKVKGSWTIRITTTINPRSSSAESFRKIMDIAYSADDNIATGKYDISINDMEFVLDDNTTIKNDEIIVNVSYSTVGNTFIDNAVNISLNGNVLTISSPAKERIDIYSMTGTLILSIQKPEGEFIYKTNELSKSIIIVKGSSGWTKKITLMR